MTALFRAAAAYLVLGRASGLYYREFTKANDFPAGEFTQLSATHTHLLAGRPVMRLPRRASQPGALSASCGPKDRPVSSVSTPLVSSTRS